MSRDDERPPWDGEDIPPPDDGFGPDAPRGAMLVHVDARSVPTPPHSADAEREVLAAVLVDPDALDTLTETLCAEDFYLERHQMLFESYQQLARHNTPIDPVTLKQALVDRGQFERVGGTRAIGELLDRAGTVGNVEHYCAIVKQKADLRRMVDAARSIEVAGYQDVDDVAEFLEEAERSVLAVRARGDEAEEAWEDVTAANVADILGETCNRVVVPTGIEPLDAYLGGGLEGGLTYVFMCNPGVGKTAFALGNCAVTTLQQGGGVVYYSCEMGPRRLNRRLLSCESGIPPRAFKNRDLGDAQKARLSEAADVIAKWPIVVKPMARVEAMLAQLRRFKRRGVPSGKGAKAKRAPLRLVVVDYWQRMPHGERSAVEGLTHAMHVFQEGLLALNIPGVILSQPSTDSRRAKKTGRTGADAKGSGAIEEDADFFGELERGGPNRDQAGLLVSKARDLDGALPHWPAEDTTKNGRVVDACGWRWERARIVVPFALRGGA